MRQLLTDLEEVEEVNKQLDQMYALVIFCSNDFVLLNVLIRIKNEKLLNFDFGENWDILLWF